MEETDNTSVLDEGLMQHQQQQQQQDQQDEPVRTLFVSGLPPDVRVREIHNFFRFVDGFEDALLRSNGVAFVMFSDPVKAMAARDSLNEKGIYFDPDSSTLLRIEMAKQNSKRKRSEGENGGAATGGETTTHKEHTNWRPRTEKRYRQAPASGERRDKDDVPLGNTVQYPNTMYDQYSSGQYLPFLGLDPYANTFGVPSAQHQHQQHQPHSAPRNRSSQHHTNTPCGTLYVANLSPSVSEAEMQSLFGGMDGFLRMQLYTKKDGVCAFVQFRDANASTVALNTLQGAQLSSSQRGPLQLEFARNEMILREDNVRGSGGAGSAGDRSAFGFQ